MPPPYRRRPHAARGAACGEDPADRPLWVYTPPGYDEGDRRYPTIFAIQGLTGQLDMWRNRSAFRLNYPELLDRAREAGAHAVLRKPADASAVLEALGETARP